MEALGLPASFGKPAGSSSLPPKPGESAGPSSRGSPSGRGPRGVVGGGKRARGRGRGGVQTRTDVHVEDSNPQEAFNGGVKRPHPSSANHGRVSDNGWGGRQEVVARGGIRGVEGRGGLRGGGSRGRGDFGRHDGPRHPRPTAEGDAVTGFYMDSFVEDPWKSLVDARDRSNGKS